MTEIPLLATTGKSTRPDASIANASTLVEDGELKNLFELLVSGLQADRRSPKIRTDATEAGKIDFVPDLDTDVVVSVDDEVLARDGEDPDVTTTGPDASPQIDLAQMEKTLPVLGPRLPGPDKYTSANEASHSSVMTKVNLPESEQLPHETPDIKAPAQLLVAVHSPNTPPANFFSNGVPITPIGEQKTLNSPTQATLPTPVATASPPEKGVTSASPTPPFNIPVELPAKVATTLQPAEKPQKQPAASQQVILAHPQPANAKSVPNATEPARALNAPEIEPAKNTRPDTPQRENKKIPQVIPVANRTPLIASQPQIASALQSSFTVPIREFRNDNTNPVELIAASDGGSRQTTISTSANHLAASFTQSESRHIAQQLAVQFSKQSDGTTVIRLNPDELGHVRMTLKTVDGAMAMTIIAERPETADLMRRSINDLAREFQSLGYNNLSFDFSGNETADQNSAPFVETKNENDAQSTELPNQQLRPHDDTANGRLNLRL